MADDSSLYDSVRVDGKKGRDVDVGGGGSSRLKEAYRASEKLPQAVLKISSYSHGASKSGVHMNYISRKGDLHLEDPQGNKIHEVAEMKDRMDEWAMDFDTRKNSRDTVNIVLSAPKGSELGAVEKSVRDFAKKAFSASNDYLFALHNDTDHPHGHLMVKMRGFDGEKLNPSKKELKQWREQFAESLRDNGVKVEASPRFARGIGLKAVKQKVHHIRKRETPIVDKQAAKDAVIVQSKKTNPSLEPWAKASKKRTADFKEDLKVIADKAAEIGKETGNKHLSFMAAKISKHANEIPVPKTRAEVYAEKLSQQENKNDLER
jgi:type IV secretion system T-DNA border endonuclease VirD2